MELHKIITWFTFLCKKSAEVTTTVNEVKLSDKWRGKEYFISVSVWTILTLIHSNIMSTQQPQRVRKIASPSMRPMKAVQPFTLKGSPTRKSPSSPNPWAPRRSPDFTYSPERKSPNSPNFRGKNISLNNVHWKMLAMGQFSRALSDVKFSAAF